MICELYKHILPICQVFQALNNLHSPLLVSLWYFHVFLLWGSVDLRNIFQLWPHQCWLERKDQALDLLAMFSQFLKHWSQYGGPSHWCSFQPTSLSTYLTPTFSACVWGCPGETVSKALLKLRQTVTTTLPLFFPFPPRQLLQKDIRLIKHSYSTNLCWLFWITLLSFTLLACCFLDSPSSLSWRNKWHFICFSPQDPPPVTMNLQDIQEMIHRYQLLPSASMGASHQDP